MKIFLVNPACLDKRQNQEDALVAPIGLYFIGAMLKENNFEVQIINLAIEHDPLSFFKWIVEKEKPDLIGFSIINPNRHNAIECAKTANTINPDIKIAFGGSCATFLEDYLFETCPELDFLIKNEGEITFLELSNALKTKRNDPLDKIKGLVFKKDGQVIKNPKRDLLDDLDTLVHPSKYFNYQHLVLSRGCPGKCTFCGSPKFWGKSHTRFHSEKWFVDEIENLYKKGTRHFFISDDTFTMDKKRILQICKAIIKRDLVITWNAISRVDYIDEDILYWMRKAGCIQISYGVESGSEKIRKILGKPLKNSVIINAFKLTVSYGIMPRAYFIYGSPSESLETVRQSVDLMLKIKPLSAIFYILVLFPGTALYNRAVEKKQIQDNIWDQPLEDIPWFEIDSELDLEKIKQFGSILRENFYKNVTKFVSDIELVDDKDLFSFHSDFLSRLAMTFSHGEYAQHPAIKEPDKTAARLFKKALSYHPDPRAFLGIAMLFQKSKNFKDAQKSLEKALKHFSQNIDLNICMAINFMNSGQFENALNYLEKFQHMPQTHNYIKICKQKLSGTI